MYKGSMVALVTPMLATGDIDYVALSELVKFHITEGTDALVPAGTTGESATINFEEHCEIVKKTVEYAAGQLPVIAGTGANSTDEAIALTASAKSSGADACLSVTPYYNKPTQEGLYLHYKKIAETVDTYPLFLYNVPGRTACDMLPDTVYRLSLIDNIVAIKEASGDIERSIEIISRCGTDFAVYSGEDFLAAQVILNGGQGVISVTANIAPKKMHQMCMAALAGDKESTLRIDQDLLALHKNLFIESNPIPAKWALHQMNIISQGIRLPLTWLDTCYHQQVLAAMKQANVN